MSRIEFRPTTAADLAALVAEPLPHRIRSVTALLDGKVIGFGGLGYRPDGTAIAFAHITDTLRRYPLTLHRAGRIGMEMIRASGVPLVVAEAQAGNPAAERWLIHFGFERCELCGVKAFVWRRPRDVE